MDRRSVAPDGNSLPLKTASIPLGAGRTSLFYGLHGNGKMTTCVLSWYWRSGADDSWGMFGALNWEGKMFDSEAYAQLVRKSRSYRRFDEGETVDVATLRDLIDLTRMTPSASNAQPMVYIPPGCRPSAAHWRLRASY